MGLQNSVKLKERSGLLKMLTRFSLKNVEELCETEKTEPC